MVQVDVPLNHELKLELAANAVAAAAEAMGMLVSAESSLAKHRNSLHWHLKRQGCSGTLEVTLTEAPRRLWASYHSDRLGGGWVQEAAPQLAAALAERCS